MRETKASAERGFTLIEVMVAILILTVGLLSLAQMMVLATSSNALSGRMTSAAALAAYDFSGNANVTAGGAGYATMMGNKTTGIQVVAGQVVVGESGGITAGGLANAPPGPPPPPGAGMPPPAPPAPPFIITLALKPSSAVCRSQ